MALDPSPLDTAADRILLIGCGALAREILALIDLNGWRHMELQCLPAQLHNTPDRIPDAVRQAIRDGREGFDRVLVLYADCGTGGLLDRVIEDEGAERIAGPHCYSFYSGNAAFAASAETEFTAFYLTDFLVRQFETMVIRPLGLDRHPELRDMYFAHYDRLIYLAQTDDAALRSQAQKAAERLGLAYEHRSTGYGDLAGFLRRAA